jgi:hypothetical protein
MVPLYAFSDLRCNVALLDFGEPGWFYVRDNLHLDYLHAER